MKLTGAKNVRETKRVPKRQKASKPLDSVVLNPLRTIPIMMASVTHLCQVYQNRLSTGLVFVIDLSQ